MKHHPEQQDDEIYMGNATPDSLCRSSWRTSRLGTVAFNSFGKVMYNSGYFPWFVKISEIQAVIDNENLMRGPNWQEKVRTFQPMVDKRTVFE